MNKTFFLRQTSRTGNIDASLIPRQHKQDLNARLMENRIGKSKMKLKEIAKELGYSNSTKQRYRQDIKMQSPYKSNNRKISQNISIDFNRHQMISQDTDENDKLVSKKVKTKRTI